MYDYYSSGLGATTFSSNTIQQPPQPCPHRVHASYRRSQHRWHGADFHSGRITNRLYRFRFSGEVRDLAGNKTVTIVAGSGVVATVNDLFFDFTTGSQ